MSQKYNGVAENVDGFISKAVKVEAEGDCLLVTPDPKVVEVIEDGDFYNLVIVAPVFKHYFDKNLVNEKLSADNVFAQIELPESFFSQEVRLVCKSGRAVEFKLLNEKADPVTQHVPRVVVKDEEDGN